MSVLTFCAQETRPVFDIHEYGDRIIQSLSSVGVKKSFAFVVRGKENTEACRYMLAALQLVGIKSNDCCWYCLPEAESLVMH